MAGMDVQLLSSDHDPPEGFAIGKGKVLDVMKKVKSILPLTFTANSSERSDTPVYVNYKPAVSLTPVSSKNAPFVTLTVTKTGTVFGHYVCQFNRRLHGSLSGWVPDFRAVGALTLFPAAPILILCFFYRGFMSSVSTTHWSECKAPNNGSVLFVSEAMNAEFLVL